MTPAEIFQFANPLALAGWASLLASPWFPRAAQWVAGLAIPLVLAVVYTAMIMAWWSGLEGGFSSLAEVMTLFSQEQAVAAGWLHYLAFDLFVGAWIVRTARAEAIPFLPIIPCLALTFLFGPMGFFGFAALRAGRAATAGRLQTN